MHDGSVIEQCGLDTSVFGGASFMRRILGEMLAETLDLMESLEGAASSSGRAHQRNSAAYVLRLSSRLAAVGGWILSQDADVDADVSVEAHRAWHREALDRADLGPLDMMSAPDALARIGCKVDALVARALRLDHWIGASPDTAKNPCFAS
jgi:hypothetical protein